MSETNEDVKLQPQPTPKQPKSKSKKNRGKSSKSESKASGAKLDLELTPKPETKEIPEPEQVPLPKQSPVRHVHFVLDNSACTLGIGNIQRWFDKEFVESQSQKSDRIHLNLYVPQYTLRELDFQKRGPMAGISLAQEAIKFIDFLFEAESTSEQAMRREQANTENGPIEEAVDFDDQEFGVEPAFKSPLPFSLYIEEITAQFPSWEKCLKYRMWHPKQKDLPHVASANEEERMEQQVEIPPRLKNVIRSCIYVTKLKNKNLPIATGDHWKLVTEDQSTKVWATSFGVDCLNVNEAELLLFHANDVTKFEPVNPAAEFFKDEDVFDREVYVGIHKKVDTTQYPYESIWKKEELKKGKDASAKKKGKSPPKLRGSDKPPFVKINGICYEEFDQINFAPRTASVPLVESKFFGLKKAEDSD